MLIFPFFGNAQTYSVCDCADIMLAMMKEAKGNMTDKDKMEAIKNKYEAKIEKCEKLGDGKSDEEKKKMEEEMRKCPSAKEAEKLMKEMMEEASTEDENIEQNTVCDCADTMLEMMKEAKGNMTDKDKMEAIKKKYEVKIEKCEKMSDGKSEVEMKKMKEDMENCPSAKEAEKLMKEMMGEVSIEDEEQNRLMKIQERADSFYLQGISKGYHSFRDDYSGAIADFTNAIKLNPKFVEAYCYRGEAKEILNDYMGAMNDFNSALYFIDNNSTQTIMIFADIIASEIYLKRGRLKNKLGDHRGAITDVSKAISFNDKYTIDEAYFESGYAKSKLKDYKAALLDYNKVIELDSRMAEAYFNRGIAKLNLNDKEGACLDFSKAGELGYAKAYELIREHCN